MLIPLHPMQCVYLAACRSVLVFAAALLALAAAYAGPVEAVIQLNGSQGLRWQLEKRGGRWTLGTLFVHDKPVDAPLASGVLALNNIAARQLLWPAATEARQVDERSARFAGSETIGDVLFRFEVEVALKKDVPAATLAPRWSVDKDLDGYEVCLAYQGVGTNDWRVQSYPFAGNSERAVIAPMRYCGVPGALVYRPDLSMVMLLAIDMHFDYLNPTTWTGKTAFHFINRQTAPQFRCGGGKFSAGVRYEHPVQLLLSDAGEFAGAIKGIMESWIKLNKHDRTGQQDCLDRAVANAYFALLYWCPKQLGWVKSPTQCAHSEQQHFNQYSVYCYGNRKIECLARLTKKTGNPLFKALQRRVMQMNFSTQVTDGPFMGSVTEAICDPWLERHGGFEWRGNPYTSELVTDLMLQLMDLGLVKAGGR